MTSSAVKTRPAVTLGGAAANAFALAACVAGAAGLSLALGQDASWDLQNYHYYNPWAFGHGQRGYTRDVVAAQLQTYHNPLPDLPFYYMVEERWDPRAIALAMAIPAGVAAFFLWKLLTVLFAGRPRGERRVAIGAAFAIGISSGIGFGALGTTMNEWPGAALTVAALYVIAKALAADGAHLSPRSLDARRLTLMEESIRRAIREHRGPMYSLSYPTGAGVDALLERGIYKVTRDVHSDRHQHAHEPDRTVPRRARARSAREMSTVVPGPWQRWWPFAIVVLAYGVVALQQIHLPGVYMDAVNPDYMAVRLLNPRHEQVLPWLLPGNYLDGRYPILISFYHGSQQMWLGLPFFWLFGTTVTGLRLTHAMFALGVLAAMYAFLGRNGLKPWQAVLACAALAIDPSFSYAFRTQSYITLAPIAWLFLCLFALTAQCTGCSEASALAVRGRTLVRLRGRRLLHLRVLPAGARVRVALVRRAHRARAAHGPALVGGLALGAIGYPLGLRARRSRARRIRACVGLLPADAARDRCVQRSSPTSRTRLAHAWNMVDAVFRNWYHHSLIFGEYGEVPGARSRWHCCSAQRSCFGYAPSGGGRRRSRCGSWSRWPCRSWRSRSCSAPACRVITSWCWCPCRTPRWRSGSLRSRARLVRGESAGMSFALPFAVLVALNVGGQVKEALRLHEVRGVGPLLRRDQQAGRSISMRARRRPFAYFPDWGLFMPVAFLTGGRIGIDTVASPTTRRGAGCARDATSRSSSSPAIAWRAPRGMAAQAALGSRRRDAVHAGGRQGACSRSRRFAGSATQPICS